MSGRDFYGQPAPAPTTLDPDLRAEIDARVARGEVTQCPPMTCAIDEGSTRSRDECRAEARRITARHARFRRLQEQAGALGRAAADPTPAPSRASQPKEGRGGARAAPSAAAPRSGVPDRVRAPLAPLAPLAGIAGAVAPLEPPRVEIVPVARLRIDRAYQRGITRRGRRRIEAIAAALDWAKFGLVDVAPVADSRLYAIVDGQHRALAAASCGIAEIPCRILDAGTARAAEIFAAINRDRTGMDRAQVFHAELAAGEPGAVALQAVLDRAGVRVQRSPKPGGCPPRTTRAVGVLAGLMRNPGPEILAAALTALAQERPDTRNLFGGPVIWAAVEVARLVAAEGADPARVSAAFRARCPLDLVREAQEAHRAHGGATRRHLARLIANALAAAAPDLQIAVGV